MTTFVKRLDKTIYPNHEDRWDDKLFREHILAHLSPVKTVLDIGAGAGIVTEMDFRGCAARICGADLDPRVVQNPLLDEGKVADANEVPYADESFDVVFANNVMEHIVEPDNVFQEIYRVLKPGGVFLFKTPNKTHYMPMIARLTPHGFHQFFNKLRGRDQADTFPTLYRVNSAYQVRKLASRTGFEVGRLERIEGRPEYLRFNLLTYLIGAGYERFVNATDLLSRFRVLLVAELRKPE